MTNDPALSTKATVLSLCCGSGAFCYLIYLWSNRRDSNSQNILLGGQALYQLSYYRIYDGFVRNQITTNWLPPYLGTVRFIPQIFGRLRRLSELIVFLTYLGICFKTTPIRRIQALIANQVDYEEFLNLISVFQCYSDSHTYRL